MLTACLVVAAAAAAYWVAKNEFAVRQQTAEDVFYANCKLPLAAISETPFDRDAVYVRCDEMREKLAAAGNKYGVPVYAYAYGAPVGGIVNLSMDFHQWRRKVEEINDGLVNSFASEKYRKSEAGAKEAFATAAIG